MRLLRFCFTTLSDWLENLRHFFNQSDAKLNQLWLGRMRFPALGADYMYSLRVLIGSLCGFNPLWLARVITLVSVLLHSIEDRSKRNKSNNLN